MTRSNFLYFILVSFIVSLVYYPGLYADFYLDDISSIVTSAYVTDSAISSIFAFETLKRAVGNISFFLSHQVSGLDPASFRLINILIHITNGILVFYVVNFVSKMANIDRRTAWFIAVFVSAMFLLHPLQTQAVTYIVQRFTSLMALFSLLSILCYLIAREKANYPLYFGAAVMLVLAVLTKETALVLVPLAIVYEYTIKRQTVLIPRLIGLGVIALFIVQFLVFLQWLDLSAIDNATKDDKTVLRLDYFKAQMVVIAQYMQSFFGMSNGYYLEYDDTVRSLLEGNNWLAYFVFHIALITMAVFLKSRMPLFAFGVLGYYIALSVESSFIPIRDVIVEHRTYFPNVFLGLAVASIIYSLLDKLKKPVVSYGVVACIIAVFATSAFATYERNGLWSDKTEFYRNELRNSPNHWRIKNALAVMYIEQGKNEQAKALIKNLLKVDKGVYYPPVLLNGVLLFRDENPNLALVLEKQLFSQIRRLSAPNKAKAYFYRGQRLLKEGRLHSAKVHYEQALRQFDKFPEAIIELSNVHTKLDEKDLAIKVLSDGVTTLPSNKQLKEALDRMNIEAGNEDE